jgi:membrane protein implicated in regulation of membrane protease activity
MKPMIIIWLIVAFLFLIAELGNPGFFFFFSFFLGSLITAISSPFISSSIGQLFIFLGGTAAAFLLLQLWIRSRPAHFTKKQETNIDALKGKRAVVTKTIEPNKPGYISLFGVLWLARSINNKTITENKWVEIIDTQGAHVIVREISEKVETI